MQVDVFDRVIRNAIDVMENSKYQIFEICESVRAEREALNKELQSVIEETSRTIDTVDRFEVEYRRSRVRLTEVSRDFKRFNEEDIRAAYEAATQLQAQLAIHREKELHLKARRDDLQKRLKNVDKQLERAESLVSQFNVVLEYLSGDLNQVTRLLESAKNRQLLGLKIILAQEEERKRIAREIHDGLAQNMANMVLRTEITERMLAKQAYNAVKDELNDLKTGVRGGIEEVRKIIFNLRPMALDDLGLVPTLRKFVQDYEERTKIRTKIELVGKEVRLPSGMEVAVYRLVQEAFSNVLKHAEASHVSLELTFQQQMIKITVSDNGVGFSTDNIDKKIARGSHYGLMGMRERVELLEGRMDIESAPGAGTKLSMVIPIKSESKEE
ncbi:MULTISPECIES: sensor histidine kinase [Paenibacillus]|uniref:Signal transduction histidine-protein kinase/phosphatase DegS n=1 Tax=Paenibacillus elgii TaxID=189691 RepID=A0A161SC70_9BACL|nr:MULTISPECIES: sensor histidine kinase [Paenibacillus]KZE77905.1 histidine kinase [Paenibacillus elgii]MCM3271434.1 sensor histidine kinase [Paenibacillus elgii]NEN85119.1 histidine kinase [Paenibacillus elgii]PUA34510.1 histidine kinase [Paenibacillus elgii]GLI08686.1 signal transduction histidine-protein kinase/phosphatase DegS [Paenibacillus tyrfis]